MPRAAKGGENEEEEEEAAVREREINSSSGKKRLAIWQAAGWLGENNNEIEK